MAYRSRLLTLMRKRGADQYPLPSGYIFLDEFNRANGAVGNSWIDADDHYAISNGDLTGGVSTWEKVLERAIAGQDWENGNVRVIIDCDDTFENAIIQTLIGYKNTRTASEYGALVAQVSSSTGYVNATAGTLYGVSTFFDTASNLKSYIRRSSHSQLRIIIDWDGDYTRIWVYDIAFDPNNPFPLVFSQDQVFGYENITGLAWDTLGLRVAGVGVQRVAVYDTLHTAWSPDTIAYDNAAIYYSPNNWYDTGSLMRTQTPGAYLKTRFTGTRFGIKFSDLSGDNILRWQVDGGDIKTHEVPFNANNMVVDLVQGLTDTTHDIKIWFGAARSYTQNRWTAANTCSISITSFHVDSGKTVSAPTTGATTALFLGDSITEKAVPGYGDQSWAAQLSELYGWEYGQAGFSYQGWTYMLASTNIPDGEASWNLIADGVSRLSAGSFIDDPDYIILNWGQNDFSLGGNNPTAVATAVENTLTAIRAASSAVIFVVCPFTGNMTGGVTNGFNAYQGTPDANCHLIDLEFTIADYETSDSLHPTVNGSATVAAAVKAEIDAII